MRVLIDTNIFISYLLDPKKDEKLQYIVEAVFEGKYTLILPEAVFDELKQKLLIKPFLVQHIPKSASEKLITALSLVVELISPIPESIPEVGTDRKDDYLFAYGAVGEADYLVTGDKKLQKLQRVGELKIVSPAEFFEILKKK